MMLADYFNHSFVRDKTLYPKNTPLFFFTLSTKPLYFFKLPYSQELMALLRSGVFRFP